MYEIIRQIEPKAYLIRRSSDGAYHVMSYYKMSDATKVTILIMNGLSRFVPVTKVETKPCILNWKYIPEARKLFETMR